MQRQKRRDGASRSKFTFSHRHFHHVSIKTESTFGLDRRSHQTTVKNRHRGPPFKKTNSTSFSHIQVAAHPEPTTNTHEEPTRPFVQNRSLQDELYNSDEYEQNTPTVAFTPGFAPFSFAQVAASMTGSGRSRRGNSATVDGEEEAEGMGITAGMGPAALSSLGAPRYTLKTGKKKSKKWSPLDLGGSEVESEVVDPTIPKTDISVPAPSTSDQGPTFTSPANNQYSQHLENFSPETPIIYEERRDSFFNSCDTPTGTTFNESFPQLRRPTNERSIIHKEDPDDTKQRLEDIMARIDDVFDVEEWDPNLPAGGANNSPEPLTIEPQRITYTTVGSVAKTDVLPVFTAPVRIQREGAGRRVPILPAPPRANDSYYGRNQQHGTGSGPNFGPQMATQQHSQYIPQQFVPPSPFNLTELEKFNLTDLEKKTLLESLGSSAATARSGNIPAKPQTQQTYSMPAAPLNDFSNGHFSAQRMLHEEISGPSSHLTGSSTFAGLNKMQTLQRLAQFENPAQGFAKGRLAEFKAVKMKQHMSDMAASSTNNSEQSSLSEHGNKGEMFHFGNGPDPYKNGLQGYTQHSGPENDNPLQASNGFSVHEYTQHGYGSRGPTAPPGYPQPLTAGPPGQRQNSIAVNRLVWNSGHNQNSENSQHHFNLPHVEKQYSPWTNSYGGFPQQAQNTFSSVITEDNHVRDTLSLAEMGKYFPAGFAPGFHVRGDCRSLDDDTRLLNLGLIDNSPKTQRQMKEEKLKKWFYGGLDRFGMSIDDHIEELENRDTGVLHPIPRPGLADREVLSLKQVKGKTEPECAEPLIAGLFGTLVAYSDNVMLPSNRRILSKFGPSPAWALDTTENGKKSVFGDNWAAPPKRLGRDPRYQRSPLNEMWGNDRSHGY